MATPRATTTSLPSSENPMAPAIQAKIEEASNEYKESAQDVKTSWPPKDAGHVRSSKPEPTGEPFDPSQMTLQDQEYLTTPDRLQVIWKKQKTLKVALENDMEEMNTLMQGFDLGRAAWRHNSPATSTHTTLLEGSQLIHDEYRESHGALLVDREKNVKRTLFDLTSQLSPLPQSLSFFTNKTPTLQQTTEEASVVPVSPPTIPDNNSDVPPAPATIEHKHEPIQVKATTMQPGLNTADLLPAPPKIPTDDQTVQPIDVKMTDDALVPTESTQSSTYVSLSGTSMEGIVATPISMRGAAIAGSHTHDSYNIGNSSSNSSNAAMSSTPIQIQQSCDSAQPFVEVAMIDADDSARPTIKTGIDIPQSFAANPGTSTGTSPGVQSDRDSTSTAPTPPSSNGAPGSPRATNLSVVNTTLLGKRKAEGTLKGDYLLSSSTRNAKPSEKKKSEVPKGPKIFELEGHAFRTQLHEDIVAFVQKANSLMTLHPWFAAFSLSAHPIGNWGAAIVNEIERTVFSSYSGVDKDFKAAYNRHMGWSVPSWPVAWECRHWLNDVALPLIVNHVSKSLVAIHVQGLPLPSDERNEALTKLFEAIAQAYLRMTLRKAQDSRTMPRLAKDGSGPLPEDAVASWAELQQLAIDIEHATASRIAEKRPNFDTQSRCQRLINHDIDLFGENYNSLFRNITNYNAETAQSNEKKHTRWFSKDAFLQDAHDKKKLVQDDGVTQLVFELKKTSLLDTFDKLLLNRRDMQLKYDENRRYEILCDVYVRLHIAASRWLATHGTAYSSADASPEGQLTMCKLSAQVLERRMVLAVEPYVASYSEVHKKKIMQLYMEQAQTTINSLIDHPLEALKAIAPDVLGMSLVPLAMKGRDYTQTAPRSAPTEIEEKSAPTCSNTFLEPERKRRCYANVEREGEDDEMQ